MLLPVQLLFSQPFRNEQVLGFCVDAQQVPGILLGEDNRYRCQKRKRKEKKKEKKCKQHIFASYFPVLTHVESIDKESDTWQPERLINLFVDFLFSLSFSHSTQTLISRQLVMCKRSLVVYQLSFFSSRGARGCYDTSFKPEYNMIYVGPFL